MTPSLADIRDNRRIMASTAAAIFGIVGVDAVVSALLPGDPPFLVVPVAVVFLMSGLLLAVGPRLPRRGLALIGPLGVALVAYALAGSPGATDVPVLYALPVVWTTFFFGRRGAVAIVPCVAVAHALALMSLPPADAFPGRWMDVMMSATGVALVVLVLEHRNELLLARLAGEARTDPLTGLLNRRGFDEHAARELAHLGRDGMSVALALLDVDHFKDINDQWGHSAGDRVLVRLARVLAEQSREIDVAARLGGEEFAVLMPGSDDAGAEAFTDRVRAALAETVSADVPPVRVSAGVIATTEPIMVAEIVERVDRALYAAKRGGRDRTVVFDGHEIALVS